MAGNISLASDALTVRPLELYPNLNDNLMFKKLRLELDPQISLISAVNRPLNDDIPFLSGCDF